MINNVVLAGRLTKNPILRNSTNGIAIANFTLAVERTFKNSEGNKEADFINIIAFKRNAELSNQYLVKGIKVGVVGRIQTRNYEKDRQRIYITEVIAESIHFLENINQLKNNKYKENQTQNYYRPNNYIDKETYNTQNIQTTYQTTKNSSNLTPENNPYINTQINLTDDDLPF